MTQLSNKETRGAIKFGSITYITSFLDLDRIHAIEMTLKIELFVTRFCAVLTINLMSFSLTACGLGDATLRSYAPHRREF
jgi:hypothetical protein